MRTVTLFPLCLSLAACGGGGDSAPPAAAACVRTVSGLSLVQAVSTPPGESCTLTVSGTGNTVNIAAGSSFSTVTVSGDSQLLNFGAGSAVSGPFTLSGSGHTVISLAADNIVIDLDSSTGSQHIEN